ncbi:hypothetical protein B0H19DRAFT_1055600 [Mycena capillaripes]|nr:hypothetical protein B0H19DRAFT_1055600 [Mycena capillaripes]
MDVHAITRFHRSVVQFPRDHFSVPPGGLRAFLEHDLRSKVFLVGLGVFEDRWATRTCPSLTEEECHNIRTCMRIVVDHVYYAARLCQNELCSLFSRFNTPSEAAWMFYLILALLFSVGFEGDDGPTERGIDPMQMALSQTEFLLRKSSESFALQRSVDGSGHLEILHYDPHRTVEKFFDARRPPSSFERIPLATPPPISFNPAAHAEQWTEAERVIEACLIALSRMENSVHVETDDNGAVFPSSSREQPGPKNLLKSFGEERSPSPLVLIDSRELGLIRSLYGSQHNQPPRLDLFESVNVYASSAPTGAEQYFPARPAPLKQPAALAAACTCFIFAARTFVEGRGGENTL